MSAPNMRAGLVCRREEEAQSSLKRRRKKRKKSKINQINKSQINSPAVGKIMSKVYYIYYL